MVIIGWRRQRVVLGAKVEECPICRAIGPHAIVCQTTWFTIFWLPVLLLRVRHGLVCGACGAYSSLSWRKARAGLRSGNLPLDRDRPVYRALHLEDPYTYPTIPGATFDRVQRRGGQQPFDLYMKAWPFLAVALIAFIVVNPMRSVTAGHPSPTANPGWAGWASLAVGNCYDLSNQTGPTIAPLASGETTNDADVTVVSCDQPHEFEVFGLSFDTRPFDASYPGDATLSSEATTRCDAEFADYVGIPPDAAPYHVRFVFPSDVSWPMADRRFICSLYLPTTSKAIGSTKGSWTRYTSPDGYSVSYPTGWQPMPTTAGDVKLAGEGATITVTRDSGAEATSAAVLETDMARLRQQGAVFDTPVDEEPLNGLDWRVVPYHDPATHLTGLDCAVASGSLNLIVSLTSTQVDDGDLQVLDSVIRSIDFGSAP